MLAWTQTTAFTLDGHRLDSPSSPPPPLPGLEVGDIVVLLLEENPSTGYEWRLGDRPAGPTKVTLLPQTSADGPLPTLDVLGDELIDTPEHAGASAAQEASTGRVEQRRFLVQATSAGSGVLELRYLQPFDPTTPAEVLRLVITCRNTEAA